MKKLAILSLLATVMATPVYAEDAHHEEHAAPVAAELQDGTKIEINGDEVSVVDAQGHKTPAPDGTHTLKDGTTVTTKDGKKAAH